RDRGAHAALEGAPRRPAGAGGSGPRLAQGRAGRGDCRRRRRGAVKLVLATRNDHKLREFREALPGIEIVPLPDDVDLPPETGETFAENALEKARAAHVATGLPAIADDSGIEAAALDGRPGVRSARFAGEDATDEQNLQKLLDEVSVDGDRKVAYVCALVHVAEDGEEWLFERRCSGRL